MKEPGEFSVLGRLPRPDFSEYVAHFTSERIPFGLSDERHQGNELLTKILSLSAYERLVQILKERTIKATPMPWTNRRAVAFTECPWGSLLDHANQYSPYGIGFKKQTLYIADGGPAIYLRHELHTAQAKHAKNSAGSVLPFAPELYAFVTPFVPRYARSKGSLRKTVDYSHEREWRVPHDFRFEYADVEFVVVKSYEDVAKFPKDLKDNVGRDRFLMMEVYGQIARLWPIRGA